MPRRADSSLRRPGYPLRSAGVFSSLPPHQMDQIQRPAGLAPPQSPLWKLCSMSPELGDCGARAPRLSMGHTQPPHGFLPCWWRSAKRSTRHSLCASPPAEVHSIAFAYGLVVGATSPMAVDWVARIASSLKLPAAVSAARARRRGRGPDQEVDGATPRVRRAARAPAGQAAQAPLARAARGAHVLDRARRNYVVEDLVTIPIVLGVEVDVRAVVFAGALLHIDGARMTAELRGVGLRGSRSRTTRPRNSRASSRRCREARDRGVAQRLEHAGRSRR